MPDKLQIHLFGSPQFTYQGKPVSGFVSNKARALLIYLAVTGRTYSRDHLADLLWADTASTKRENLRKTLSNLRRLDGVRLIEDGHKLVALDMERCWVDAIEFECVANDASINNVETLQSALQLYQGDFLAGFNTSLGYEFEVWAIGEVARFKALLSGILSRLTDSYAKRHDLPQAIATARRLLQLEAWQEETHRRLIELLASHNDVSDALAHFDLLRAKLREELDADPSEATLDLVARIRAGTLRSTTSTPSGLSVTRPAQAIDASVLLQKVTTTVEFQLVGRDYEWQVLRRGWRQLEEPHFICIGGEAGIGKTRLAEELLQLAEGEDAAVARTRSHALQGQLAYGPITDWLRSAPLQSALQKLEAVWLTEITRLLPELFSNRPDLSPPQPLRENWQCKRFFDALRMAFTSANEPLLLVLDDLQWSDTDTLEFLQYLVESGTSKLLLVGTVRSNELAADHPLHHVRQQLRRHDRLTDVPLSALDPHDTTELANEVTAQELASDSADRLFHDTAGNPLFVIESMRATPERNRSATQLSPTDQGAGRNQQMMPPKIYSVIQSRLAQLSPEAQLLAQLAATIGRAFDVPLLAMTTERSEESVIAGLDELWQRRIIREVDATRFDFSHDRIRDVAYAEISPLRKRLLHRNIVNALQTIHARNLDAVSGHLAVHCEAAGLLEQAITFYQRAADGAKQLFAHYEAVNYRQQALSILRQLPRNTENKQAEIDLLLVLSRDRINADGLGSPPVYLDLQAASALAQKVGTAFQKLRVLNALVGNDLVCGKWIRAHELSIKTLAAAVKVGDPIELARAHSGIAGTLIRLGYLEESLTHYTQIEPALAADARHKYLGHLTRYAYCLWLLGFPEQAVTQVATALRLRRQYEPDKVPIPLHHYSSIALFCGEMTTVDTLSAELVELTTKRHDDFSLRWGNIYRGWLLVQEGKLQEGILLIRENADEHRARGNYFYECVWRSLLAEAYLLASDLDAAFGEIDSTLAYAQKSGDLHWNAQLLKLRGDCLQAAHAPEAEIERHYQLAIGTARQQKSRSLELRATTSLCRLWQKTGKGAEALHLLADIYGWFSEGFETGDLVEAKKLLAELEAEAVVIGP